MSNDKINVTFSLDCEGILFSAKRPTATVLECSYTDGLLDFQMVYDYLPDAPLHLSGKAEKGDRIEIHVFPYRIELYVNGVLTDEEWPCGNRLFTDADSIEGPCAFNIQPLETKVVREPTVLGTFQNAEGWKPEENVYVGDCMPFAYDGRYHVVYLKDRHRHQSKWGKGAHQWSHISTEDFLNWDIHPMMVEIDDPAEGSVCTGSWIYDGAKHDLFYTIRACDDSPAKICRSVSSDGFHFEKDRTFSFTLSNKYTAASARDPKMVRADDGIYHMILTTSLTQNGRGCLAHLISKDMNEWVELENPLYIAPENAGEPECPDYFYKDGFYYLIYSLGGKGYYQYSRKPFTDWFAAENPIIPCKSVPKAAIWQDRLIFAGFDGQGRYAGTMTFLEAVVQENGELAYQKMQ